MLKLDKTSPLKPSTAMSDQERISLNYITTKSSRQAIKIEKNINQGIVGWSNTKVSELTSKELYRKNLEELLLRS